MAGLFGSPKVSNNAPVISSLRVQTSCYGKPIPLLYGMPRVAVNVIQYEDFQAHAHSERAAGGKGGGGASSTTSYTYTVAIVMALGSGPILSVPRVWRGKEIHAPGNIGLDVYLGSVQQAPFPYIAGKFPDRAYSYPGIAYLAAASYELGSNASLDNHNAEVATPVRVSPLIPDADVSAVIQDLVTNPITGLRLPDSALADLTPFWSFCRANGIFVSPAYTEQKPAKEMIQALIDIGFADAVYSENRLKIVPYSDAAADGNGAAYRPNRVPVYELTEDDFTTEGAEPPVIVERKHGSDVYNHVQVKFYDRGNDYNEQVAEDKDAADIDARGLRTMLVIEAKEICVAQVASRLANFKVRRAVGVRNAYSFSLPWKFVLLEATDIVLLTLPSYGFDRVPVLITEMEEDEDGRLTFKAEDYPMKSTAAVQVPSPESGGYIPDFSVDPGNANIPVMFEPPHALTDNRPELWLATAGGENWGGAEVWVSLDNASYKRVGRIEVPSRHGSLAAALPAGAIIDTANLLKVDVSASRGQLLAGTHEDAKSLVTLCYVGGEYLAYAGAMLTGVNTYNLSYLVRGAHGSDNAAHAAGSPFVRLDAGPFRYAYPKEWLGKTIWVKLVSFNRFNSGIQALAEVPAFSHVLEGAPLPAVSGFRFEQPWIGAEAKLAWDPLDGASTYDVDVQAGLPVAPVRSANQLTATRYAYSAADMAADGGPWRSVVFRARGRSLAGRTGPWAQLLATNPQVGPLAGIKVDGGIRSAHFSCERPDASDFAGVLVWMSTEANFVPSALNLVYDGPGTTVTLSRLANGDALDGGRSYYIRAAGYDTFGKDQLSISGSVAVTVAKMAPDRDSITQEMLKDGVIDVGKFAAGIEPVTNVTSVPSVKLTNTVFNIADGKLYRWDGAAYVAKTPTSDLTGTVSALQIAAGAVTASKLAADAVTAGAIAAGAVGAREIAAGAITTTKIAIGNFDNIVPDPDFIDPVWWHFAGIGGYTPVKLNRAGTPWNSSGGLAISRQSDGPVMIQSQGFPVEFGAKYRVRLQVSLEPDFVGKFAFFLHIPGVAYETMGQPSLGVWPDGLGMPICQNESSPKGVLSFEAIVENPVVGSRLNTWWQFCIKSQISASKVTIGGLSVVRVSDATLIQDGAISTGKLTAAAVTGDKIAANTITADKLVVNSITGDRIAASTITGDRIAAGAISTDHLLVGQSANMLTNPGFESDYFAWSQASISGSAQWGMNLNADYTVPAASTKTAWVRQAGGGGATTQNVQFYQTVPCEADKTYMGCAYTGAHRCRVWIVLQFLDAANKFVSPSNPAGDNVNRMEAYGAGSLSAYKRIWFRGKAPPGAVRMVFTLVKESTNSGEADSYMFVTRPYAGEVQPNQTAMPAWDAAGATMIGPGNIATKSLSAISATIGLLRTASSGARMELESNQIRIYDENNTMRWRGGIWQ